MQESARPTGPNRGAVDVRLNRTDDGGDHVGFEPDDRTSERRFRGNTSGTARRARQLVDRFGAKVNQVTAGGLESTEKCLIGERRLDSQEGVAHGAV